MLSRSIAVFLALVAASGAPPATPAKASAAAKRAANKPTPPLKASSTVRRWMKSMTLRDEVAQLIFISFHGAAPNSRSREYRRFMAQTAGIIPFRKLVKSANG